MVTRRENIKRYIKVIVEQLSEIVDTYSSKDRELLLKFLHPLQKFEEADFNRSALTRKFYDARNMIINHDDYLNLPFSWFAETYFENAEIALQISLFHAHPLPTSSWQRMLNHANLSSVALMYGVYCFEL